MMKRIRVLCIFSLLVLYCICSGQNTDTGVELIILGTVQDAGAPHAGCIKSCCTQLWDNSNTELRVSSIGLIDPVFEKRYMFDATPDLPAQMHMLMQYGTPDSATTPDGIFLTHAHIGHYTGLMYLGKESMNALEVPVHVMQRMELFLQRNKPWKQLVRNENITLEPLLDLQPNILRKGLSVTPFLVPHRDEYSETVGYLIRGPEKRAVFIPDIDKWAYWKTPITEVVAGVDYAFLDGTFYDAEEINNRDISEIPHPFITETMRLFEHLPAEEKAKIHFIHMNHTNPALDPDSEATKTILEKGYNIARMGMEFKL